MLKKLKILLSFSRSSPLRSSAPLRECISSSPQTLRNSESGHAMIEMAIGLVFLFNITAGVIDFGSVLNDYSAVVEAAHQGALLAATNNHLARNTDQKFGNCTSSATTARTAPLSKIEQFAHEKIDERVQRILNINDSSLENQSLCVTSSLEDSSSPGSNNKNVVVTVQVDYKTILFGSIPIKAQSRAPFLQ